MLIVVTMTDFHFVFVFLWSITWHSFQTICISLSDGFSLLPIGIAAIVISVIAALILIIIIIYACCVRQYGFTCWGLCPRKRRVVYVRNNDNCSKSSVRVVERATIPRRKVIMRERPQVRPFSFPVHIQDTRSLGRQWITPRRHQRFIKLNGTIACRQQALPAPPCTPRVFMLEAPPPPKPKTPAVDYSTINTCNLPTASLQRGATLQLVSGPDDDTQVLSTSNVLTSGMVGDCNSRCTVVGSSCSYQPSPTITVSQSNQQAPMAFINVTPSYESHSHGGSFEINGGSCNTFGRASATYMVIPHDLPQAQSVIMEPYAVENSTAEHGTVYIQENGDPSTTIRYI